MTTVTVQSVALWDVTSCSLVDVYQSTRRRIPEGKLQIDISLTAEVYDPSAMNKLLTYSMEQGPSWEAS